jgi:hypothetical protein
LEADRVATLADVLEHRRAVDDVATLALRDLLQLWRGVETADAPTIAREVQAALPDLVELYGEMAASLGADWYDELRDTAGAPGRFDARLADPPPGEQLDALARWGVTPVFSTSPDPAAALSLLSGGLQRAVVGMDRGTVEASALADPAGPVWTRQARPNACAFCRMLSTRGAVYGSEEAATRVVGRTGGARGLRELGSKYHDHCHCTSVPTWPGQEVPRSPEVDGWTAAYTEATSTVGTDTSAVLAHMRQALGAA